MFDLPVLKGFNSHLSEGDYFDQHQGQNELETASEFWEYL